MKKKQVIKLLFLFILLILIINIILLLNKKVNLPANYKLWYENNEIVFGKKTKNNSFIIVSKNIKAISFNDEYIIIKQKEANKLIYYLIDIKNNKYTDNISEKDLNKKIKTLKIKKIKWCDPKKVM